MYKKVYEALQMGLTKEFSVAYTACENYSDGSTGSEEDNISPLKDNTEEIIEAYIAAAPKTELKELEKANIDPMSLSEVYDPPKWNS